MNRISWFAFIDKLPIFLLSVLWAAFIFILSTVGVGLNLPASWWEILSWDKLAHAFVYFVLTFLLYHDFKRKKATSTALWLAFGIATAFGITMEIVQYTFFPNRYFEVLDIIANIVGAIGCVYFLRPNKTSKTQ